jgi:hypothetical protein
LAGGNGIATAILDTNFSDLHFDAVVSAVDFSAGDAPGLVFRASQLEGDGDYYWARLRGDRAELGITRNSKEEEVLGYAAASFESGVQYHVRLTAVGEEFQMFVDDMGGPLVTATDSSLERGRTGVVVTGSGTFDNVAVSRA